MFYEPTGAEEFEGTYAEGDGYEVFACFDGSPLASTWIPVGVHRIEVDEGKRYKPADFPWIGAHAPIMRKKAVDALKDMLEKHGETLPLKTDDGVELFVFNSRVVDALDMQRSVIAYFPGTKDIMRIKKVVLREEMLRGVDIFKLPGRAGSVYVSDKFIERVKQAGLVGLNFTPVEMA